MSTIPPSPPPTPPAPTLISSLLTPLTMIIISEIGDKTFLIAALLSMRHPRHIVFLGAFGSLALMSALSATLGHVLPTLIPRTWTQFMAGVLFLVFGVKMWGEGRAMGRGNGKVLEEMREAEEEIESDSTVIIGAIPLEAIEAGRATSPSRKTKSPPGLAEKLRTECSLILGPVFVQAFVLTFLGEWGDRSQIATIALGAAHNVWLVTLGTILGHSFCTALAVLGGRYVSTKISVRAVTLTAATLFFLFGIIYLYEALVGESKSAVDLPLGIGDIF